MPWIFRWNCKTKTLSACWKLTNLWWVAGVLSTECCFNLVSNLSEKRIVVMRLDKYYIMWRHSQAYRSTYLSWSSFYAAIIHSWCGDQSSSRGSFLLIVFEKRRTCSYLIKKAEMMRIIKYIDLHLVTWSLLWMSPGTLRTYHAITWAYHGNKATHVNEHLPTSF